MMEMKSQGRRYEVKLKLRQPMGALVFVPDLGNRCACCNAAPTEWIPIQVGDNTNGPYLEQPLPVPTCAACKTHIRFTYPILDKIFGYTMGIGLCLLISCIVFSSAHEMWPFTLAMIPAGLYFLYYFVISRRLGGEGHHSGITFFVARRAFYIHTSNLVLVRHVLQQCNPMEVTATVKPPLTDSDPPSLSPSPVSPSSGSSFKDWLQS